MRNELTRVLLIRHGDAENPKDIFYVRAPGFHLSKMGVDQVNSLVQILNRKNFKIKVIYSSPLERAQETAQILRDKLGKVKIEIRDQLLEVRNPGLQGRRKVVILKTRFNAYAKSLIDEGAETPEEIILRTRGFIDSVLEQHKGEDIALVFHADPIRLLLWSFQNHKKGEVITTLKIKDKDYPGRAEAIVLSFDKRLKFLSFEHVRGDFA